MFSDTLRHPDLPQHPSEPGYSPVVAKKLIAALDDLRRPASSLDALEQALSHLETIEDEQMSMRQQLLTFYALGKSGAASAMICRGSNTSTALSTWPSASTTAGGGRPLVPRRRGGACPFAVPAGAKFLSTGLDTLKEVRERGGAGMREDPAQELAMHILLAGVPLHTRGLHGCAFPARRDQPPRPPVRRSRVSCGHGRLAPGQSALRDGRSCCRPAARHTCDRCHATASSMSGRESYARLQTVVADTVMDIVEELTIAPPAKLREGMLTLAYPYVERGMQLANGSLDPTGAVVAVLTQVRFDRLCSAGEARASGRWGRR